MKFYTWKDIDRYCLMKQNQWNKAICSIDVYPDEMIVYMMQGIQEEQAKSILYDMFPRNLDKEKNVLLLDRNMEQMKVSFETEAETFNKPMMPLFKKVIYKGSAYPEKELNELECPVIVFHSYKGGVGRTLSLLAFAKSWTSVRTERLLIVDSDIEAPGLSWIQGETNENAFSYLDLLTLIQDGNDIDDIVDDAIKEIGSLSIPIETEQQKIQHIFLQTSRYDEQLFDLYASPDTVIQGKDKEYILADVLSRIALRLGASAVLVDSRAGISEYSAPLLFDPRVKKYLVTSTSSQSVIGTEKLLKYISKGLTISADSNLPTILLSMVPNGLLTSEKNDIVKKLVACFDTDEDHAQLLDNIVVELPFASELVHLTNLQQILNSLKGRDMYTKMAEIVEQKYAVLDNQDLQYSEEGRTEVLKRICEFADQQISAEANGAVKLLLTEPIKNLCNRYSSQIPTAVVCGTKGSGKTFLYRQLLVNKNWSSFCTSVKADFKDSGEGWVVPVFAPKNIIQLSEAMRHCIDTVNDEIGCAEVPVDVYVKNSRNLEKHVLKEQDWIKYWEQLLVSSVNKNMNSFDDLNSKLCKNNKKIVFLIDGLEEILRNVSANVIQQKAVQVLCQDIINIISARYDNIGIILFLRSDMAQNAIKVNYEQFKQAHSYAALKWTSNEALRLVVWIISQSVEDFYESSIPIEVASQEVINRHLEKLWGLKLGKNDSNEAYSSRWILAALSDFNGQLQARDIIRFLKYASQPVNKKASYEDRIIMPAEIRHAVSVCSVEKITEIRAEYEDLKPILDKMENLPLERKVLPLNLGEDVLSPMEEKLMIQEGYLTRDGDKLYLPEIIRHALGFRYEKGARPKVLSLLLKHE